jgi:hypothetical protein
MISAGNTADARADEAAAITLMASRLAANQERAVNRLCVRQSVGMKISPVDSVEGSAPKEARR